MRILPSGAHAGITLENFDVYNYYTSGADNIEYDKSIQGKSVVTFPITIKQRYSGNDDPIYFDVLRPYDGASICIPSTGQGSFNLQFVMQTAKNTGLLDATLDYTLSTGKYGIIGSSKGLKYGVGATSNEGISKFNLPIDETKLTGIIADIGEANWYGGARFVEGTFSYTATTQKQDSRDNTKFTEVQLQQGSMKVNIYVAENCNYQSEKEVEGSSEDVKKNEASVK